MRLGCLFDILRVEGRDLDLLGRLQLYVAWRGRGNAESVPFEIIVREPGLSLMHSALVR